MALLNDNTTECTCVHLVAETQMLLFLNCYWKVFLNLSFFVDSFSFLKNF